MIKHSTPLFIACALLLAGPAAAQTTDIAGTWDVSINTGQETIPAILTLTKQGDKLTGAIKDGRAPDRGEANVEVTLAEKKITMAFDYADADGPMHIVMNGTVDKDAMSGAIEFGSRGQGEWTAKKSTAAAPAGGGAKDAKVDVSGTWSAAVTTSSINASPTIVLKQDGEKLTGQYVSTQYGSFPLTGTVKGNAVAFSVELAIEGNAITASFSGTVEKDAMSGSVHYGDFAEGTFTAKKK